MVSLALLVASLVLTIILGFLNYSRRVPIYTALSREANSLPLPIKGMVDAAVKGLGVRMLLLIIQFGLPLIPPSVVEFLFLVSIAILFLFRHWIYQGVLSHFKTPSLTGHLLMLSDISFRALGSGFLLYMLAIFVIYIIAFLA